MNGADAARRLLRLTCCIDAYIEHIACAKRPSGGRQFSLAPSISTVSHSYQHAVGGIKSNSTIQQQPTKKKRRSILSHTNTRSHFHIGIPLISASYIDFISLHAGPDSTNLSPYSSKCGSNKPSHRAYIYFVCSCTLYVYVHLDYMWLPILLRNPHTPFICQQCRITDAANVVQRAKVDAEYFPIWLGLDKVKLVGS